MLQSLLSLHGPSSVDQMSPSLKDFALESKPTSQRPVKLQSESRQKRDSKRPKLDWTSHGFLTPKDARLLTSRTSQTVVSFAGSKDHKRRAFRNAHGETSQDPKAWCTSKGIRDMSFKRVRHRAGDRAQSYQRLQSVQTGSVHHSLW